jgi:RNA polymerase sigma factor (sigma-70 family)
LAAVPSIGRASRVERRDATGAAAAGDLYERYSGQIFGYCLHQLGSREEAEDAVQTTFMNAFRGLQRGIVPELESAWLFKIAHNVCLSRRRSSWRRGRVEAPNNFEVLQEVVPGREQVADELIRLQDVLEDMPENQRRAILLREWQGLTYREISSELGLSQAAVETLIFRARRALAQGLEQDADTWKKRLRRGADVGGAIACVKTLLGGGGAAAIKVGTTAAVVATAAVGAVTTPAVQEHSAAHRAPAAKTVRIAPAPAHGRARVFAMARAKRVVPPAAKPHMSSARPHASGVIRRHAPTGPTIVTDPEETAAPPRVDPPPAAAETAAAPEAPPAPATESPDPAPPSAENPPTSEPEVSPPTPANPSPGPADNSNNPDKPDKPDKPDNGHGNGKDHK